jgi:hypothetical protein
VSGEWCRVYDSPLATIKLFVQMDSR